VHEAMKRNVRTIAADRPLSEAADMMKRFEIEHLVVADHHRPIGLLSDGDVLRNPAGGTVRSAMSQRVVTIDAEETVTRAANMMRGHGIKCLVVTKDDKLEGIITSSDVLEVVSRTGHKERMVMRDRGPMHATKA
ncbi:MAG: CBS domain-containing protein, partial [Thermoanaerobaculia bacterium]